MANNPDLARRNLLATALVGALLPKTVPEGHVVRAWLDSWAGIGHVVEGMHELGYNVRVDRSPFPWTAEFRRDQFAPLARCFATEAGGTDAGEVNPPGRRLERGPSPETDQALDSLMLVRAWTARRLVNWGLMAQMRQGEALATGRVPAIRADLTRTPDPCDATTR